ncbi:MAG TPA: isocitrate/isopropylmalate family dehydrogenase, partial [Polyangiaceae bacterium]
AASANIHASDPKRVGMFEPVHGSAPPLAGKNLANPLAAVQTVGMLLAHLGHKDEEKRLEQIAARAIAEKKCTKDVGGELGTTQVGDFVMNELAHAF